MRSEAKECGVPVIGDNSLEAFSLKDCLKHANEIGYPLILKASNGGGGKGIRVVECEADLPHLLETCQKEMEQVFGKSSILTEKYIENGKHIEVQVLADQYGNEYKNASGTYNFGTYYWYRFSERTNTNSYEWINYITLSNIFFSKLLRILTHTFYKSAVFHFPFTIF